MSTVSSSPRRSATEPGWRAGGRERLRAFDVTSPRWVAALVYGVIAAGIAVVGFFAIFSQFAVYDDEGTLLTMLRAFVDGDALYRDIYTPYGPFYFEFFGGLAALTGIEINTDSSRLTVLALWVVSSGLYGIAVQRLTGSLLLGASGMVIAYVILGVLVNEPMHPQVLATLLLAGLVLVVALLPPRRLTASAGLAGVLVAGLVMTKINLGIFALAAMALAAVLAWEPLHRRRWVRWPVVLGFLALPIAITARDLDNGAIRDFVCFQIAVGAAVVIAASAERPREGGRDRELGDWLITFAVWVVAAMGLMVAALLLTGPSIGDVYDGIVSEALRIRDAVLAPLGVPLMAFDWAAAALAGAVLVRLLRGRSLGGFGPWPGALRIIAGLTIWLTAAWMTPFQIAPDTLRVVLPLTLVWVAAIPPAGGEDAFKRFARGLFPALAVTQVLQVYPVPGSQVGIAAALLVPVGAICVADGIASLREWATMRGGAPAVRTLGIVVTVAAAALLGKFGYEAIVRPGIDNAQNYSRLPKLDQPGASLMRTVAAPNYQRLVGLLREHRCSTFVSYPSYNSLYLWSSLEPPKPQVPGPWMVLLDDARQQRVVDQLRRLPRPCALRNEGGANAWMGGKPRPDAPLVNYLFEEFEPVATVGEIEFLLPKR